jgi:hypothetical protein
MRRAGEGRTKRQNEEEVVVAQDKAISFGCQKSINVSQPPQVAKPPAPPPAPPLPKS